MMTYLLKICYDGAAYGGFQRQQNADTVGQRLLDALKTLFGTVTDFTGCSRTDAGVHAHAFYLSFSVDSERDGDSIVRALNGILPRDIAALSCGRVPNGFHARYDALGKRYVYQILNRPARDPFYDRYAWHVPQPLDAELLSAEAETLIGTYDFSAFAGSGCTVEDRVRTVTDAHFVREGDLIRFSVCADGFLYHMVRIMVGTLVDGALGRLETPLPVVLASADRSLAGRTAPAHGLFLEEVYY